MSSRQENKSDSLTTKTGGAYIPPARLRLMQEAIKDKNSKEFQRLYWESLKKSINGLINKVNISNIAIIVRELLKENLIRGMGLFCRSVMSAQAASPTFTHVYAALIAIINTKFPQIGELLLHRLVHQFRRAYVRNDKPLCISIVKFFAHLTNQGVCHEILALELMSLFLENSTDDSVELAVAFIKEVGKRVYELCPKPMNGIFETLRHILQDGKIDKRVQYMIEVLMAIRKDKFKDHPIVIPELDLVEEDDKITHLVEIHAKVEPRENLNVFQFDENFEENQKNYEDIKREILGESSDDEDGSGEEDDEDEDDEEDEGESSTQVIDMTEMSKVALRRTIYLTFQSSLDFEECAHKLLKLELKDKQIEELCYLTIDCCAQQRTYIKFYGLLAQRFCSLGQEYVGHFSKVFGECYEKIHRFLDTNKLRNVAKFFAHLLFTDSIEWTVLSCIEMTEEKTTSSGRVFVKILLQELAEYMGIVKLSERMKDPTLQKAFEGLFPRDNPRNTRFAINFFTLIGLGPLTEDLRLHLEMMPPAIPSLFSQPPTASTSKKVKKKKKSKDSSSSDSSSESSSDSSSESSDESSSSSDSESDSSSQQSVREDSRKSKRHQSHRSKDSKRSRHDKEKLRSSKSHRSSSSSHRSRHDRTSHKSSSKSRR